MDGLRVGVVGATGAVGQELLGLLESRCFPVGDLRVFASERSAGKVVRALGRDLRLEAVGPGSFDGLDVAFFSAGTRVSQTYVPVALEAGAIVIDNSSAFRMKAGVPLIVPEVNAAELDREGRLFPVGNCTAILLCVALGPLRDLGTMRRVIVSTYQSASGGGARMMHELREQTRRELAGEAGLEESVLPHPYAFNLFSHNTEVGADGHNGEEAKVMAETRKILGLPELAMNVTCVRVPVLRAHSESVTVEFEPPGPSEEAVREALSKASGVRVVDDRAGNHFPMPSEASGVADVLVGRIRRDPSHASAISLFLSGDQLLKGAALNAIQIAEALVARRALPV